jgi:pyruvate,water dikinase
MKSLEIPVVTPTQVQLPDRWITDTPTTARFPHVTRANADEVAPLPMSPLGWRIGWINGALPGVAEGYVRFGIVSPDELSWPVPETFGNWGGYFYNQLSLSRLLGVRMPGGSPQAIDRAYFGENPNVPPYVADPRDVSEAQTAKLVAVLEAVMTSTSYPPFDEFVAFAVRLQHERPDLTAMPDSELVRYALGFGDHLRYTWDVYCYIVLGASIGPGAVHGVCEGLGRAENVSGLFSAVGDVVSASSATALWQLSRVVAGSAALTAAFDQGEQGVYERIQLLSDPESARFLTLFAELLREHGHRGPNEWDLASPTWRSDTAIPMGMIARLRRQDDASDPSARAARNAAEREKLTAELVELVAAAGPDTLATFQNGLTSGMAYYRMREMGKDAAVRVMDEARAPLRELGARWTARGVLASTDHVFQLLDTELAEVVTDPAPFRQLAADRAAIFAMLSELEPPYVVSFPDGAPPMPAWPKRGDSTISASVAGEVLKGIGVSSGTATGTARVVHNMADSELVEPGDVIVCTTTDPSWVPLFLIAGAVICNVGALGSHAAIVTRELGIPCAVSVPDASSRIPDGATVSVDGNTGVVTVIALPPR